MASGDGEQGWYLPEAAHPHEVFTKVTEGGREGVIGVRCGVIRLIRVIRVIVGCG